MGKDKIDLPADCEARARELANGDFGKLFERVVSYVPCKAFEELVPKLLTPARETKLMGLCSTPTKGKSAHCRDYRFAPITA